MGKKYIIELEDEPLVYNETTEKAELWRVKGFKSLVFDNVGLEKLTPYNEESSLIFNKIRHQPIVNSNSCVVIKPHAISEGNAGKIIDILLTQSFCLTSIAIIGPQTTESII